MTEIRWVVAAAVVDDLDRPSLLLAARRTEPEWAAGLWELPGGGVEPGEEHELALHRELAEELGIHVDLGQELTAGVAEDQDGWPIRPGYRLRVWWAQVREGDPAAIEDHDAIAWLAHGTWHELDWLPSNAPVVQELQRRSRAAEIR